VKVVLFCGGLGTRLREHSETIPKPLVTVGNQPIVWHLMRYYAHYGHRDFVLCLGYRGDLIREYFLNHKEQMYNDFTLHQGSRRIELHQRDASDWNVTCVDTGLHSKIGERLRRVRKYLDGEPEFLANYSDALANVPLDQVITDFRCKRAIATFVSVRSPDSFTAVQHAADGTVTAIGAAAHDCHLRINGGFFVLRHEIFEHLGEGEELVEQPFTRLIEAKKLVTFPWDGFWQCMDTLKDKLAFDGMEAHGESPWKIWETENPAYQGPPEVSSHGSMPISRFLRHQTRRAR
jgi:glucose-1-phosphate cytidylyltransferase